VYKIVTTHYLHSHLRTTSDTKSLLNGPLLAKR
jgi:hypothetical protein